MRHIVILICSLFFFLIRSAGPVLMKLCVFSRKTCRTCGGRSHKDMSSNHKQMQNEWVFIFILFLYSICNLIKYYVHKLHMLIFHSICQKMVFFSTVPAASLGFKRNIVECRESIENRKAVIWGTSDMVIMELQLRYKFVYV